MEIAVLADTHIPDREQRIPEQFRDRIREADHVVHAGDFTGTETLEAVREMATELTAVHGNMDPVGVELPTVATVEAGGVTVVVTHGHVDPTSDDDGLVRDRGDWFDAVATTATANAEEPRVGVGAHTHQLEDDPWNGVRVLNPGSVTGADPAEVPTMLTLAVDDGEVTVTAHEG